MPLSHLPPLLASAFTDLAHWLDKRTAARLPLLLTGGLFARGRRTVTSWFKARGRTDEFRQAYTTVCSVGRAGPASAAGRGSTASDASAWPSGPGRRPAGNRSSASRTR